MKQNLDLIAYRYFMLSDGSFNERLGDIASAIVPIFLSHHESITSSVGMFLRASVYFNLGVQDMHLSRSEIARQLGAVMNGNG